MARAYPIMLLLCLACYGVFGRLAGNPNLLLDHQARGQGRQTQLHGHTVHVHQYVLRMSIRVMS